MTIQNEAAAAQALVDRYLELFTDDRHPVIRQERALPASKEQLKEALLLTAVLENARGVLSPARLHDYREIYTNLAGFGSPEQAAKSAALFIAGRQFKSAPMESPQELLAIGRIIGGFGDVDLLAKEKLALANEFDGRWTRALALNAAPI